ncbi:Protein of unknown function [Prosthecobacter debontii]|uniref:DUF3800 domain-containing protein n=1 Tax=Prosthecobacter debontii TaxID=48467 RepID=A0A1T4Z0W0_9BACT|nr:DUF3800 domain-containing protein [Prosthecobacter debontii]SKB07596.1 Protein of unknown function [Prosthecobacter debontii]
MNLIYLDESGNTGKNLADPQQPVFVLGALIVPEGKWQLVETDLEAALDKYIPSPRPEKFEIHAGDVRQGSGYFKEVSVTSRIALRDNWLRIANTHGLKFIYRAITKKRYQRWLEEAFGKGVTINPHLVAFPLLSQVINKWLKEQGESELGILISDENREVVGDIERFQRLLRAESSELKLDRIIEKGFFIDSQQSCLLQLADLCTYQARKKEERIVGLPPKSIDDTGIELLEPLIYKGQEAWHDVIQWLSKLPR